jgi:hypothetical protein
VHTKENTELEVVTDNHRNIFCAYTSYIPVTVSDRHNNAVTLSYRPVTLSYRAVTVSDRHNNAVTLSYRAVTVSDRHNNAVTLSYRAVTLSYRAVTVSDRHNNAVTLSRATIIHYYQLLSRLH